MLALDALPLPAPPPDLAKPFRLNAKQRLAMDMLAGDATHFMLYGGARSGKTFLLVRALILRALLAPGSRHLMVRFRLVHIKSSIIADTFPAVIKRCFPELASVLTEGHHKSDGYYRLPNGSEIWYAGLDEKERTEKVLGQEYATILIEECSQIPWASRELLRTRLAQKVYKLGSDGKVSGELLRLKALYAENPPLKSHWTYKLFIERISPDTLKRLGDIDNYASLQVNPRDNAENVNPQFLRELDTLGERQRKRFRDGMFGEAGEAALWTYELIEQQRLDEVPDLNEFIKIVVAVDPSGADSAEDAHRDEIGIVVAGLRKDGSCVILEDVTFLGGPAEWGGMAVKRAMAWEADTIVAEQNFGGAMVKAVIQSAATAERVSIKIVLVTASRGKTIRAEPISALYDQQKVWHVPGLDKLEDELCQMTTYGYTGDRSPNRADAAVWAVSYLFPAAIKTSNAAASGGGRKPRINLGYAGLKRRH